MFSEYGSPLGSAFFTQFGNSLGNPIYFLVCENGLVFALSFVDYSELEVGTMNFVPYSLLTDVERNKVWDSWKEAVNAAEMVAS